MSTSPQPQAAISPAQFELKRLRSSIHAVTRISGSSPLVEALQAVEHLFEIVLPDPNQQPEAPPPVTLSKGDDVAMLTAKLAAMRELIGEAHDELKFSLEAAYRAGNEGAPRVHRLVAKLAAQKVPTPCNDAGVTVLPDGSAFSTMSFPLPVDHWLTAPACEQWDSARDESADLPHPIMNRGCSPQVGAAVRWAIRAATTRGQCQNFDPDALVQNITYALCGPAFKTAKARDTDLSPTASSPVAPE